MLPHPSQSLYWKYIEKYIYFKDTAHLLWANELKLDSTMLESIWPDLLLKIRTTTNVSKLRLLQYKILNKILVTNVRRAIWDKTVSPLCSFCYANPETILHILVECPIVHSLWNSLERWLIYYHKKKITFTPEIVILNNYDGTQKAYINTLILVMKQYIYSSNVKINN